MSAEREVSLCRPQILQFQFRSTGHSPPRCRQNVSAAIRNALSTPLDRNAARDRSRIVLISRPRRFRHEGQAPPVDQTAARVALDRDELREKLKTRFGTTLPASTSWPRSTAGPKAC